MLPILYSYVKLYLIFTFTRIVCTDRSVRLCHPSIGVLRVELLSVIAFIQEHNWYCADEACYRSYPPDYGGVLSKQRATARLRDDRHKNKEDGAELLLRYDKLVQREWVSFCLAIWIFETNKFWLKCNFEWRTTTTNNS